MATAAITNCAPSSAKPAKWSARLDNKVATPDSFIGCTTSRSTRKETSTPAKSAPARACRSFAISDRRSRVDSSRDRKRCERLDIADDVDHDRATRRKGALQRGRDLVRLFHANAERAHVFGD